MQVPVLDTKPNEEPPVTKKDAAEPNLETNVADNVANENQEKPKKKAPTRQEARRKHLCLMT